MNLIYATIDKHDRIVAKFDEPYDIETMQFKAYPVGNSRTLYVGNNGDAYWFCLHDKRNETGFGGARFKLNMLGGEQLEIKGPWSSRSSVVNMLVQELDLVECITDGLVVCYASASTLEARNIRLRYERTSDGEIYISLAKKAA